MVTLYTFIQRLKVRITLYGIINSTTGNYCSVAFMWRLVLYLVPRPHCSARPMRYGSRGASEFLLAAPCRSSWIRHRNVWTEKAWKDALQGLGGSDLRMLSSHNERVWRERLTKLREARVKFDECLFLSLGKMPPVLARRRRNTYV